MPRELLKSELCGHDAGAFTGAKKGSHRALIEQAQHGTVILDEIGEMPVDLQAKMLKVIEDHNLHRLGSEKEFQIDVQLLAAANQHLEALIKDGGFIADLYHRLSVFKLQLPQRRERV